MSSKHNRGVFLVLVSAVLWGVAALAQDERDAPQRPSPRERRQMEPTEEEAVLLIEVLAERQPGAGERLKRLRETDPEQFRQALRRLMDHDRMRPLLALRRNDPEGFDLQVVAMRARANAGRIKRQLQQAQGDEAGSLREQLRTAAGEVVDAEIRLREHELSQLEKRLGDLQKDLARRRENRGELVEQYYGRLTRPAREPGEPADRSPER